MFQIPSTKYWLFLRFSQLGHLQGQPWYTISAFPKRKTTIWSWIQQSPPRCGSINQHLDYVMKITSISSLSSQNSANITPPHHPSNIQPVKWIINMISRFTMEILNYTPKTYESVINLLRVLHDSQDQTMLSL